MNGGEQMSGNLCAAALPQYPSAMKRLMPATREQLKQPQRGGLMIRFSYARPIAIDEAIGPVQTEQPLHCRRTPICCDLMKENVTQPEQLIDITQAAVHGY